MNQPATWKVTRFDLLLSLLMMFVFIWIANLVANLYLISDDWDKKMWSLVGKTRAEVAQEIGPPRLVYRKEEFNTDIQPKMFSSYAGYPALPARGLVLVYRHKLTYAYVYLEGNRVFEVYLWQT